MVEPNAQSETMIFILAKTGVDKIPLFAKTYSKPFNFNIILLNNEYHDVMMLKNSTVN